MPVARRLVALLRGALVPLALVSGLAGTGATGCGAATSTRADGNPPRGAVRAYVAAVRQDDPRAAYALLTADQRRLLPFADFERAWRASAAERRAQASALERALAEDPLGGQRARLKFADGKATELARDEAGWRLEEPLLAPIRARTPQDALRLFVREVERGGLEGTLRLLSSESRKNVALLVEGIKANLDEEIPVVADRATLRFVANDRSWRIKLVREDGEWRIDDVYPWE